MSLGVLNIALESYGPLYTFMLFFMLFWSLTAYPLSLYFKLCSKYLPTILCVCVCVCVPNKNVMSLRQDCGAVIKHFTFAPG